MQTRTRTNGTNNGFIIIGGVPYRRSRFTRSSTSIKDWALFSMIIVGLVVTALLTITSLLLLVWASANLASGIWHQIQQVWR